MAVGLAPQEAADGRERENNGPAARSRLRAGEAGRRTGLPKLPPVPEGRRSPTVQRGKAGVPRPRGGRAPAGVARDVGGGGGERSEAGDGGVRTPLARGLDGG